jgi:hypothetical protein
VHLLRFCYANTTTRPLRLRARNLRTTEIQYDDMLRNVIIYMCAAYQCWLLSQSTDLGSTASSGRSEVLLLVKVSALHRPDRVPAADNRLTRW